MPEHLLKRHERLLSGAGLLVGLAFLLFFLLGMHRGLLLSSDIKSRVWPWAPYLPPSEIEAPALSDPVWQFVPWLQFARRELRAGRLPLWNPHQDGGVPLLGNSLSALLSPLVWPVLLLGADPGWNLSLLFRILLAAAGTYAFLRELGRSRLAASMGAVAFAVSGPFIAWLEHPQTLAAAPVPLLLLFARRLARRATRQSFAGLALAAFLVLAGGHPETQLMAALLAAGVMLIHAPGARSLLVAAGGGLLGAGLAAPVLLPFLEYFRLSAARLGHGRQPFTLPLRDLFRFLLPRLPDSNVIEAAATVSVALLLLVPLGLWAGRRRRETLFWAALLLAMLVVIYDNPLSRALALSTPVYWTRFLLFVPLALAVLGSAGLDALRERMTASGRPTLSTALGCGILLVAVWELLAAARGVHGITPPSLLSPATPILGKLAADRDVFRVLPLHTFLTPHCAKDYGLDDVRGYDALAPAGWRARRAAIGTFADAPTQRDVLEPWNLAPGGRDLDFWNVKYLLLHPQFAFGAETLNRERGLDLEEVYSGPDGRVLRNRRVLPRARLTVPGSVAFAERRPTKWVLEVEASSGALLIVANPFFPGWRAALDGRPLSLRASPGDPITIAVPSGKHRVELTYKPVSFRVGAGTALLAAVLVIAILAKGRRR